MTAARGTAGLDAEERAALALAADILDRFPAVFAATRVARGLSQEAAAAQLGVDRQTVQRWESGKFFPQSAATVCAVLRWLARGTRVPR